MNIIQENWKEKKIHYQSGFLFKNGKFLPFDIIDLKLNEQFIPKKEIMLSPYSVQWAEVFIQESLLLFDNKGKIFIGSGGLGADGFIALVSNEGKLVWSIFSESTNGFIEVVEKENLLFVESGSGYNYSIPIDNPLNIRRLENKSPFNNNGERTNYKPYPN